MKRFLLFVVAMLVAASAMADRPIFLVTPTGVYRSIVDNSGKPGNWESISADVVIQGFRDVPDTPKPDPPSTDPVVLQIAAMSKTILKDSTDATAVSALVESVSKLKLSEADFRQSLEMGAPIMDASMSTGDRITQWTKKALAISADPAKLKAGLASAFGVEQSVLDSIHAAATDPTDENTAKAINWNVLISVLQTILTLLQNLGIKGA